MLQTVETRGEPQFANHSDCLGDYRNAPQCFLFLLYVQSYLLSAQFVTYGFARHFTF